METINQTHLETLCRKMLAELEGKGYFWFLMKIGIKRKQFATILFEFGEWSGSDLSRKLFTPETHKELCEVYECLKQIEN